MSLGICEKKSLIKKMFDVSEDVAEVVSENTDLLSDDIIDIIGIYLCPDNNDLFKKVRGINRDTGIFMEFINWLKNQIIFKIIDRVAKTFSEVNFAYFKEVIDPIYTHANSDKAFSNKLAQ
jgi:hypothetical protein